MGNIKLAGALLVVGAVIVGCNDNPIGVEQHGLAASDPSLAVRTGETFSHIRITRPTAKNVSLAAGGTNQMAATLYYSGGGSLPSAPYAQWRSTDPCVATVTTAHPSWGLVRGVRAGTAQIIAEAWGRADTATVTVTGTGDPDPSCSAQQWSWDFNDVSFTGTPSSTNTVTAGEQLTQLVLFAGPRPDYTLGVGKTHTLRSELWYDRGGRLNGRGYVTFTTTDPSVATINSRGVVTARGVGRTRVIARLGANLADTVPLFVTQTGAPPHPCAHPAWVWDFEDQSFTGTPSNRNTVTGGEKLTELVLFAGPQPDCSIPVGGSVTLQSELQYDRGGKLNGRGFVNFSTTDPSVATINSSGVVRGVSAGMTRVIVRLGTTMADTVPLYVR